MIFTPKQPKQEKERKNQHTSGRVKKQKKKAFCTLFSALRVKPVKPLDWTVLEA
jgi:hypothetical protein